MSAARMVLLPLLPHAKFTGRTPSLRRQYARVPVAMRPAFDVVCDRATRIAEVGRDRLAVVVHRPSLRTLVALVGLLCFVDLLAVAMMVLRPCRRNRSRVFAGASPHIGPVISRLARAHNGEVPALVLSGASPASLIVRVAEARQ